MCVRYITYILCEVTRTGMVEGGRDGGKASGINSSIQDGELHSTTPAVTSGATVTTVCHVLGV